MDILGILATLVTSLLFLGLASLASYWSLLRNFQPRIVILMGALVILVYVGGSFAADQMGSHPYSWAMAQEAFDQKWQVEVKSLNDEKMPQVEIDHLHENFKKYFIFCLPAWIFSGALFIGFLAYYLVATIGSRYVPRIAAPIPFWQWMIPEPMIFGLIIAGVIKLLAADNTWMVVVGDNLLVLFIMIYTFAGLPIISFYFKKWRFPAIARFLSYSILLILAFNADLFEMLVNNVFCVLSVMDIWLDFRKLKKPPAEPPL